jgi:hypothetical protein
MGTYALKGMSSDANSNTAAGTQALFFDSSGSANTALGYQSLSSNTTGMENTAVGVFALVLNSQANNNTAVGYEALDNNDSGATGAAVANSAVGASALYNNLTGANNTAFGYNALYSNTSGKGNAAQGVNALYNTTSGIRNLGIGSNALFSNTTGGYNIALGFDAGYNVTTGSNNIEIGSQGSASDNNTIQIGVQGTQTATTIAGIFGTTLTGSAVYVTATGQLGVLASSDRYKTDVKTMGAGSNRLHELRPVTFKLKTDPQGPVQYGLIAEEVAKVYPELVIRNPKGEIQGVRYEELAPMLLSEMQKQQQTISVQSERFAVQDATIHAQSIEIHDLKQQVAMVGDLEHDIAELRTALAALQSKDQLVARR